MTGDAGALERAACVDADAGAAAADDAGADGGGVSQSLLAAGAGN
jgi:hypothetical protein